MTNLVQDMGGAVYVKGGAVATIATALRILSHCRWLVHSLSSGELDSKYDETSYFESSILALHSMRTLTPAVAI